MLACLVFEVVGTSECFLMSKVFNPNVPSYHGLQVSSLS